MTNIQTELTTGKLETLTGKLKTWAQALGFAELRITDTDVSAYVERHKQAIEAGLHGDMHYLERNQALRYDPRQLLPGTARVICARMNYLPDAVETAGRLKTPE
jgi:epoxyqueuosine reductase